MRVEICLEEMTEEGTHTDNFEHWGYYRNPKAAIKALEEIIKQQEEEKND